MSTATEPTGVIVVGMDGSKSSKNALKWAVEEAKVHNYRVHVINAWDVVTPLGKPIATGPATLHSEERDKKQEKQLIDKIIADVVGKKPGVEITTAIAFGQPVRAMLDAVKKEDAEMLVLGSRGRGGFKSLLLGSVSQQCATYATCPVVIVRDKG